MTSKQQDSNNSNMNTYNLIIMQLSLLQKDQQTTHILVVD